MSTDDPSTQHQEPAPNSSAESPIFVDEEPIYHSPGRKEGARIVFEESEEPEEITTWFAFDPVLQRASMPSLREHPFRALFWLIRTPFAMLSVFLFLAVIAAVPGLNFLAMGYLLEAEGRVARTGRWRESFPLIHFAPRILALVVGMGFWTFLVSIFATAAADSALIDPNSQTTKFLQTARVIFAALVGLHLCLALARGGRINCFFRPLKNVLWLIKLLRQGRYWETAEASVKQFFKGMQLREHFWLGLRGYAAAALWLLLPTAVFAIPRSTRPPAVALTLIGGGLLTIVFCWVPFLQARFAAENRFRAALELGAIRKLFRRAPLAWLLAIVTVFVLALPLYIFKVRVPPRDAAWFFTIIFIVSIYPARVITGWAYHRAIKKDKDAHWIWCWTSRLVMVPLVGFYVFLLYFTQFVGEHGKAVLFEHHAFLLPVPF